MMHDPDSREMEANVAGGKSAPKPAEQKQADASSANLQIPPLIVLEKVEVYPY